MPRKPKLTQEERSRKTREKIMKAGELIFGREGFHKANIKLIADEAKVAVGSFYLHFKNKKELFLELVKKHNQQGIEQIFVESGGSFANIFEQKGSLTDIIKKNLEHHRQTSDFVRVIEAMLFVDKDVRKTQDEQEEIIVNNLVSMLKNINTEVRVEDIEAAARVTRVIFTSLIHYLTLRDPKIEEDRLTREMADVIQRYLFYMKV